MPGILRRLDIVIENLETSVEPVLHRVGADKAGPAGYQYPLRFGFVFQNKPEFQLCLFGSLGQMASLSNGRGWVFRPRRSS